MIPAPRQKTSQMKEQRAKRRIERILSRSLPTRRGRRVVLCYHSIHPSKGFASATPVLFEEQIEWLQDHCEIVSFSSISQLPPAANGDRPVVAITFDDGYADNHAYALPILLAHDVRATIFVTTGLLDRDPEVVDRFRRLWSASTDEVRGLSWSQVSELRESGFEIGAHTRSHPKLSMIGEARAAEEISSSKATIEDHLEEPVLVFAYPFGKPREHLSEETVALVGRSGFDSAATVSYRGVRKDEDPLTIPRFPISQDNLDVFSGKINGKLDAIALWQEHAPLRIARLFASDPARPADEDR